MRASLLAIPFLGLVACGTSDGDPTSASSGSGGAAQGGGGAGGTTTTSNGGAGGSGGTATGGTATGSGGAVAPSLFFDFVAGDSSAFYSQQPHGSVTFGAADSGAHDGNAAALLWNGGTDVTGPGGKATEIGTNTALGFGEYRFRVKLATCQPDEELVNGHFLYQNDGLDHDGDGIIDNDEIDIEILCAQPGFINLTSWTGYTDDAHMRKKSRTIDLETGTLFVGLTDDYGHDATDPLNETIDPALAHPGWYDPSAYYEMGWDWQADHVRWFIVLAGKEVTLWTLTDASRVPQHQAKMLFNLWRPASHWNEDGTPVPAKEDATLSLDWFSFTDTK